MPTLRYSFNLLLLLLLMSFGTASGQDIDVSVSKSDINSSPTHLHKLFGHDRDHFYSIKFYGNQYYIGRLSRNLDPEQEEPIRLFKGLKTYQLETVVHFYDELYVFVSRTRLTDITLYYQKISKETLQPVTDLVEVVTVQCVKGAWADFHFALSRNETKLLVASRIKLSWSKAQFNELFVFGNGLELVWKKKDSFEFRGVGPRDNHYNLVLNKFDEGLLARLAALKEPMLRNEEVIRYEVSDMVVRRNGQLILIAEQVFDQPYNTYNNLIITAFDIGGQVYWTQVVEKNQDFNYNTHGMPAAVYLSDYRQYVMETGYLEQSLENLCSYALMAPVDKTGIILFYNDDIRNREPGAKRKNFNQPKKSYLLAVKIDAFGNMTQIPLNAWKKKAMFPEPIRFYDTKSDTLVIPAFRYRKYCYYRIVAPTLE